MMDYAPLLEEVELEGSESEHDHEHDHDDHDHDHEGESEMEYDEHIWTSPVIAKDLLYVTRDAIIQADLPTLPPIRKMRMLCGSAGCPQRILY